MDDIAARLLMRLELALTQTEELLAAANTRIAELEDQLSPKPPTPND